MDLSKDICENLRKLYPNDFFLAISAKVSYCGNFDYICNNNVRVIRLPISSGEAVDDDALKSLLHRAVFESRTTKPNNFRAEYIFDRITKMLPGRNKIVLVSDENLDSVAVKLYGSHKGTTDFKDSEFGAKVTVILY